jgi:oxalate---CoA ligase
MSDLRDKVTPWLASVHAHAQRQGTRPALMALGRRSMSFEELSSHTTRIGAQLRRCGVARDSRVALMVPQGAEAASALLSVMAHAVCMPLNPSMPAEELMGVLRASGARVLLVALPVDTAVSAVAASLGLMLLGLRPGAESVAGSFELELINPGSAVMRELTDKAASESVDPDHAALILHTSGTTGVAKRVVLTHSQLGASARNIAEHLQLSPNDRSVNVMPLFHSHGIVGVLLSSLTAGASVVCQPTFEPRAFFDAVASFQPTWYSASPTIHASVLEHATSHPEVAVQPGWRFVRSTSSALPAPVLERLEAVLRAPVIESFGMTEWSQMVSNPLPPGRRKAGAVGQASGVDLALLQPDGEVRELRTVQGTVIEGELLVRGAGLAQGYDGDEIATAQAWVNGWFRTGDLARVDADGFVSISGRLKDLINRGGEKLTPLEIESALLTHAAVRDAAVFAVPHPTLGEDVVAAVVLHPGASAAESVLREHLFSRLADFKVPSTIIITDAIPRSATGKVQRSELSRQFAAANDVASAAPQTPLEHDLHGIFCGVLDRQSIGVDDNFFTLGGDSLSGMRVISRINKQRGIKLPPATLFRHPSIRALALQIQPAPVAPAPDLLSQVAALSDAEVLKLLAIEEAEAARRVA